MSRPEFLADHDRLEQIVAGVLRRVPTVEFIRVRDIGSVDRPDAEAQDYAANHELIIVSHDVNTMPAQAYDRIAAGQARANELRLLWAMRRRMRPCFAITTAVSPTTG